MCQAGVIAIFDKIRQISKECKGMTVPEKIDQFQNQQRFDSYHATLEQINDQLIKYRYLEDEYDRLQRVLQQEEALNRRRVGFEQQMRLYCDSLKLHLQEVESEKIELLENSKAIIKGLKKVNEKLYLKANREPINEAPRASKKKNEGQTRGEVTDRARAFSMKDNDSDELKDDGKDIGEILKTEFIERPSNLRQKAKKDRKRTPSHFSVFEKGREEMRMFNIKENSQTFQVLEPKTDRDPILLSKKKHKRLISNISLSQYAKQHRKEREEHLKSCYAKKSTEKQDKGKLKNRLKLHNRSLWKEKNANRSVCSVSSLQAASSIKETL